MSILTKAAQAIGIKPRELPEGVEWYLLRDMEQQPCKKCGAILPYICAASPEGSHDGTYKHKLLLLALSEQEAADLTLMGVEAEPWAGKIPKHKQISQADPFKSYGAWAPQHREQQAPKEELTEGYSNINEEMGAPPPMEQQIKRLQGS